MHCELDVHADFVLPAGQDFVCEVDIVSSRQLYIFFPING